MNVVKIARVDLMGRQRVKHECVIGIWAMRNVNIRLHLSPLVSYQAFLEK